MDKYKILLLGQKYDKKEFLSWYFNGNEYIKNNIQIRLSGQRKTDAVVLSQGDGIEVSSFVLPVYMTIDCRMEDDTNKESYVLERYDKIIFLSSWHTNLELEQLIEGIIHYRRKHYILFQEILLVFLDKDIKTGVTDVDTSLDDMNIIKEKYSDKINVQFLKKKDSVYKVLRSNIHIENTIDKVYRETFSKWKEDLQDPEYGMKFEFKEINGWAQIDDEVFGDPTRLEQKVYAFYVVRNEKDILVAYFDNFYDQFYDKALKVIIDFYKDKIEKICVWNLEKDIEELKKSLKNAYDEKYPNVDDPDAYPAPENELDYDKLVEETKIKDKFRERIKHYYEREVIDILYAHMINRTERIREILGISLEMEV